MTVERRDSIFCRPTERRRGGERDGAARACKEGARAKYFPFKAERDRGGEEELKKEKTRGGRARGAILKKTERCHPADSNAEAEPRTAAGRGPSSEGKRSTQHRGFDSSCGLSAANANARARDRSGT